MAGVIQKNKKNKRQDWDEDVGEKSSDTGKEDESEHEATCWCPRCEAKNKGAGKAGSSTDVPARGRSSTNRPVTTPPYKKNAGEPDSPASIEKRALSHWRDNHTRMQRNNIVYPRRYFHNSRGEEVWEFSEYKEGLTFKVEDYSPILQVQSNGNLTYQNVPAYNSKWLPKDADKHVVSPNKRISFNPVHAWVEDRWVLTRRLAGDRFCQVIFYYVCDFVWKKNDLSSKHRFTRQ